MTEGEIPNRHPSPAPVTPSVCLPRGRWAGVQEGVTQPQATRQVIRKSPRALVWFPSEELASNWVPAW